MLNVLRKNYQSIWIKGAFGAIVLVFVFWGIGSVGASRLDVAVRVGDDVITAKEFNRAYQLAQRTARDRFKGDVPPDMIRQQTLDQLITQKLLTQEAERLGLSVSDEELRNSIAAMPIFQRDGRFDKDAYVQTLRANGFKPAEFQESQRQELLLRKVQVVIGAGVQITDQQLKERYRFERERVNLRVAKVASAALLERVSVSDKDVKEYYDANKERFREPERATIQYAHVKSERYAGQIAPSNDEIQAYYDAHAADYHKPEEVRASHILFKLPPGATGEQKGAVRARAAEVLAKIRAGGDFAALAREHSEDSTAAQGGDLGFFPRGQMVKPFEDAAFALAPGAVSDVVESNFGFHIIRCAEKRAERTDPLASVRDGVIAAIRRDKSGQMALEKAEQLRERVENGEELRAAAQSLGLPLESPAAFSRDETVAGLPRSEDLAEAVFTTPAGGLGDIVSLDGDYVVFRVLQRAESFVPELDKARAKVTQALRAERATAAAKEKAEALRKRLQEKPDLDALAAAEGLTVQETGPFGRGGGFVVNVGNVPPLKEAAFRLTPEQPVAPEVYETGGDAVIAVLKERLPADESKFDQEKKSLLAQERRRVEMAVTEEFVNYLKGKAQIEIGQGYTNSAG